MHRSHIHFDVTPTLPCSQLPAEKAMLQIKVVDLVNEQNKIKYSRNCREVSEAKWVSCVSPLSFL